MTTDAVLPSREREGWPGWHALLISVGAYRHHPVLRSPAADGRRLEEVLADPEICGFARVDRLEDPTAEQARRAVTGFLARHGEGGDGMLIYFSGRGKYDFADGRLHLLAVDSPALSEDDGVDGLTDEWLMASLAMVRSDRVFVVLDTCFGGAALGQVAPSQAGLDLRPPREVPYGMAFRPMVQGHGFHTLAAAAGEPACAAPDGVSHLTRALVEVLRDGSAADETGRTSVGRLSEVVTQRVVDSGCGQTPLTSAHQHGRELYLARHPRPRTHPHPHPPTQAGVDLAEVRQALANRDYAGVRRLLRPVKDSDNGEYRYYAVLGMFGGHRPREFATDDIRRAEAHLAGARALPPQLCALWALIKEDHYIQRGIDQGPPAVEELMQAAREIDPFYAAEIAAHLPAPECQTWARLRNRAQPSGAQPSEAQPGRVH